MNEKKENRLFPRSLKEVVLECIQKYFLPAYAEDYIMQILENKRSIQTLVCCHGGCEVCNDTIINCYEEIIQIINEEGISGPS